MYTRQSGDGQSLAPESIKIPKEPEAITTGLGLETEISVDKKAPRPVHRSKLSKKSKPQSIKTSSTSSTPMRNVATSKRPIATNKG